MQWNEKPLRNRWNSDGFSVCLHFHFTLCVCLSVFVFIINDFLCVHCFIFCLFPPYWKQVQCLLFSNYFLTFVNFIAANHRNWQLFGILYGFLNIYYLIWKLLHLKLVVINCPSFFLFRIYLLDSLFIDLFCAFLFYWVSHSLKSVTMSRSFVCVCVCVCLKICIL